MGQSAHQGLKGTSRSGQSRDPGARALSLWRGTKSALGALRLCATSTVNYGFLRVFGRCRQQRVFTLASSDFDRKIVILIRRNMMGVWGSNTKLSGSHFKNHYEIALITLLFLTCVCINVISWRRKKVVYYGKDGLLRKSAFSWLGLSTNGILLAYMMRIVDLFLSEYQFTVKRGYFFTRPFTYSLFGVFADFLMLMIVCRMAYYLLPIFGSKDIETRFVILIFEGLLVALLALALFQLALSVAYYTLYLNDMPFHVTDQVLAESTKLHTSLMLLYFVTSTLVLGVTLHLLLPGLRGGLADLETRFLIIITLLFIRSIAGAIVAVHYDLKAYPKPINLDVVREALYGLPSIGIYYLVTKESHTRESTALASNFLRQARRTAGKDFARRYRDATLGGPPYPSPAEVFDELERKPFQYFSRSTIEGLTQNQLDVIMADHLRQLLSMRNNVLFWSKFTLASVGERLLGSQDRLPKRKGKEGRAEVLPGESEAMLLIPMRQS